MSAYDEAEYGAAAEPLGTLTDEELWDGMHAAEHEWRSRAFMRVFDEFRRLNPRKAPGLLFDGYGEDVISRRMLMIRYPRSPQFPTAVRVILNDHKLSDEDLTQRIVAGKEYLVRPVGHLIAERSCTMRILPGQYAIGAQGFMLEKPLDDPVTTIIHGRDYRPEPIQDQSYATALELQDRRMAAESLAGLLETLRPEDAVPTHYFFRPASRS